MWLKTPPSYEKLLSDENVQLWIDSYQSPKTRDDYIRCLEAVCNATNLAPSEILGLSPQEARRRVLRVVQGYLKEGKAVMAKQIQIAVRGFFEANDRELKFKRTDRVRRVLKKINNEIILSKEEVYRIADATRQLRDKAIILCLYQSGVRVGCLCGWTVGMVKSQLYPKVKVPVYIKVTNQVDTKLTGYGLPYYHTFLHKEAAETLRAYLDERMENEGALKDSGYLFAPLSRKAVKRAVDKGRILYIVKAAVKAIGIDPKKVWTHTLRKTFRKVLYQSGMDPDMAEAIMGHKLAGSKGSYFDYHDMDEIAANYMKANFSRATVAITDETVKEIRRQQLRRDMKELYGLDLEEVLKPRVARLNRPLTVDEELETLEGKVRELWGMKQTRNREQKVIHERELEKHLAKGWRFSASLNNGSGKVIVEKA